MKTIFRPYCPALLWSAQDSLCISLCSPSSFCSSVPSLSCRRCCSSINECRSAPNIYSQRAMSNQCMDQSTRNTTANRPPPCGWTSPWLWWAVLLACWSAEAASCSWLPPRPTGPEHEEPVPKTQTKVQTHYPQLQERTLQKNYIRKYSFQQSIQIIKIVWKQHAQILDSKMRDLL